MKFKVAFAVVLAVAAWIPKANGSEQTGPQLSCYNGFSKPPCCCGDNGGSLDPNGSDDDCDQAACGDSCGGSFVDNISQTHHHWSYDYTTNAMQKFGLSVSGCSTCGGGGKTDDGLWSLEIKRIHRYRQFWVPSSFSPGIFSNFDSKLQLTSTAGVPGIGLFDAEGTSHFMPWLPINTNNIFTGTYVNYIISEAQSIKTIGSCREVCETSQGAL